MILAGTVIATVSGDNGIIMKAVDAKRRVKVEEEKEILKAASIKLANMDEDDLNIKKQILQRELDEYNATVYINEEELAIYFNNSKGLYSYDGENINQLNGNLLVQDENPGELEVVNNEYIINSIEDLVEFSSATNGGNNYSGKTVKLGKSLNFKSELSYNNKETTDYATYLGVEEDITLMESLIKHSGFKPIGAFAGTFDGQNNIISNLYENNTTACGLFSSTSGTIQNLGIINATLTSNQNMGAICAESTGTVKKCYVKGKVNITENGSSKYVGILVGSGKSVEDSYSDIDITIGTSTGSSNYLGGITGCTNRIIERCYNKMEINSSSGFAGIGGISGKPNQNVNNPSRIEECFHRGNFNLKGTGIRIEGIESGWGMQSSIKNCYNIGDMKSNNSAGISEMGDVSNCYSIGKVTATYCGGAILRMNYYYNMIHCYARSGDFKSLSTYNTPGMR